VERTERDLLEKAQGGNLFAFEEVVRRYQRRVYGVAMRIVRRHDVADDVTQEAFLRAHQKLDSFDTTRPFGPWICRIAANLAISHVRSPRAREEELGEGADEAPAPGSSPLDAVLEGEARERLAAALDSLPPEQRAVFVLRSVEEMSYREIAGTLEIPVGSVMSRLSRARNKLRAALAGYLGPGAGGAERAEGMET
jgi:RNA polymerase sigma-70 factor (ECF subfamily)